MLSASPTSSLPHRAADREAVIHAAVTGSQHYYNVLQPLLYQKTIPLAIFPTDIIR
jgi:hypothetical protein